MVVQVCKYVDVLLHCIYNLQGVLRVKTLLNHVFDATVPKVGLAQQVSAQQHQSTLCISIRH